MHYEAKSEETGEDFLAGVNRRRFAPPALTIYWEPLLAASSNTL